MGAKNLCNRTNFRELVGQRYINPPASSRGAGVKLKQKGATRGYFGSVTHDDKARRPANKYFLFPEIAKNETLGIYKIK